MRSQKFDKKLGGKYACSSALGGTNEPRCGFRPPPHIYKWSGIQIYHAEYQREATEVRMEIIRIILGATTCVSYWYTLRRREIYMLLEVSNKAQLAHLRCQLTHSWDDENFRGICVLWTTTRFEKLSRGSEARSLSLFRPVMPKSLIASPFATRSG